MTPTFETDKRRYIRYEILECALVRPGSGEPFRAVIVDIGLGGLQLRARQAVPIGIRCQVEVGRDDRSPVVLEGEVRHCAEVEESDLIAIGVRFTPADHDERIAIAEFVHAVFQRQCDLLTL